MKSSINLAQLIEGFFLERLLSQRRASPNTVVAYRDTFRLLFKFIHERFKKAPSLLTLDDLTADRIIDFLGDLEKRRGCSARSRNQRLAGIRSFFHYLAFKVPERSALIQQILAIPNKRYERVLIDFLNNNEIEALLASPDQMEWLGRRDYLLLSVAIHTGLRISELTTLIWSNVCLAPTSHVRVVGKGRKERAIPLSKQLSANLARWRRSENALPNAPVFPSRRGASLSSDAVQRLLAKYSRLAEKRCPSLTKKRVSPHVLRHSTAMRLLQSGVGQAVIALWLGHESVETTQIYLNADLKLKEKVLKKTAPIKGKYRRYEPSDTLMAFLEGL